MSGAIMWFASSFYLSLATIFNLALGLTVVSTDEEGYGAANYLDDLQINAGKTLSFDNRYGILMNIFTGEVTNNGRLFITDSGTNLGMTVNFMQGIYNTGEVVLNAVNELGAPTFNFLGLYFVNHGSIYMGGEGAIGTTVMDIWPLLTATPENYGTITFAQTVSSGGVAYFGQIGQSVYNNGTICLSEINLQQDSSVSGTGCYSVGNDSMILLDSPVTWDLGSGQTVYLETPTSAIRIGASTPLNNINIAGWGNGNMIGFAAGIITGANIDGEMLVVYQLFLPFYFYVGPGYDSQYIQIGGTYSKNGFIVMSYVSYSQPPPNPNRPDVCNPCGNIYQIPAAPTPKFNFSDAGNTSTPPSDLFSSSSEPLSSSLFTSLDSSTESAPSITFSYSHALNSSFQLSSETLSSADSSSYGSSSYGSSTYGSSTYGSSTYGSSTYGSSTYGSSTYGSSTYGSSTYGSPGFGSSVEPSDVASGFNTMSGSGLGSTSRSGSGATSGAAASSIGCSGCTSYITTVPPSISGAPAETAEIIVTTQSDGSLTTLTSPFSADSATVSAMSNSASMAFWSL
ncbi:hypothetical protein E0198_004340 [Clavispora lusitaniae]|nr:hypothetical protein E0198_004340 [Clavispora lusitaniae]